MRKVRVEVEWIFAAVVNYFKFLDFKKNLKVGLSAVGKMYLCCGTILNADTCLYGSTTSTYFGVDLPMLDQYFL